MVFFFFSENVVCRSLLSFYRKNMTLVNSVWSAKQSVFWTGFKNALQTYRLTGDQHTEWDLREVRLTPALRELKNWFWEKQNTQYSVISYLILLSYFFFKSWSKPQTDDHDKENGQADRQHDNQNQFLYERVCEVKRWREYTATSRLVRSP